MLSTPPATTRSWKPARIPAAAKLTACCPEPQKRLRVTPGASSDQPASSAAMRAMSIEWSPLPAPQPMTTSSTSAVSNPLRSRRALSTWARMRCGCTLCSAPFSLPLPRGERTASMIQASCSIPRSWRIATVGAASAARLGPMAHDHGHGHVHGGGARAGARHAGRLRLSFLLIVAFLVVQVAVGLATGSLALLSDAGHMATDALGLGMALAAIHAASSARSHGQRTFGLYRLEILAALLNAALLFLVAGYVLVEAARRFGDAPDIASAPVLVVGVIGLAVNLAAFALLRSGAQESLNVQGAYLEVLSDTLGSVGVVVA